MPSDSCDHRRTTTAKPHGCAAGAPPPEPEHLPCPRCDSTNTKFCYYNNYNFSQPRHFCKACRRYWTHGGTLRDIPIGGGSRKNAKRSRITAMATHGHGNSTLEFRHMAMAPPTATPILLPFAGEHGGGLHFVGDVKPGVSVCESFTSLLNSTQGPGFFGVNVGGFDDGGFGFGRAIWPFSDVGHYAAGGGGNTWQLEGGEGGHGGECLTLPDLAISTPGMI
ncbi:hypothetical protein L1987_66046 [Smallanthus sonchifolius]|uniref:Uncharacterized protein n=1 Tax=Smallanthus sonchifolius TaxID=185202 RepID=A0ACB9BWF1_9ASTR|nr:hypothetical protein L1987_66046 [Smallanthus sonchifolius]